MKVIVCLDKSSGMMFNNRRQSRDAVLIEDVINYCGDNKIMCNSYSAELFNGKTPVCVSETFLTDQTCPIMIQKLNYIFARKPLISSEI